MATFDPSNPPIAPGAPASGALETPSLPYRIQGKIGEGSMGVVFRAIEPALGRTVAIKFLKTDPEAAAGGTPATREMHLRFLQEARSAATIQHPGAVTIYRVGQERGVPFIAMEWLDGETLATRLARVGRLGIEEACDFAIQALDALQAAHDAGVVHRDIKPANLMILRDGRVKVLDFGIARFRSADLLRTESGVMLGTPAYAAPEQLRAEEVDARSDLYSLGMVLYEALAGRLPHSAESLLELATKVLRDTPTPIGVVRPDLPPPLVQALSRALAKDRAARWPSAREMARALRAVAPPRLAGPDAVAASPTWERAGTIALPHPESGGLVYRGVPAQLPLALAHLVSSWPAQSTSVQSVERLLARLLDKPPHAPAFSGGVALGSRLLLLHDGQVLAAIDRRTGRQGAEVADDLGASVPVQLHPVPDALPKPTVQVLAGLLGIATLVQGGLDSSIVHLPGLAAKLASDQFDGVVRVRREGGDGRIVLVGGEPVLAFFSGGWDDVDLEQTWTAWVGQFPLAIEIEKVAAVPLDLTWSLRLRDLELACERSSATGRTGRGSGSLTARRLPLLTRRLEAPSTTLELSPVGEVELGAEGWRESPAVRLLDWLLTEGAAHFAEAKVSARWKYLAEWLPLVRRAKLYTDLRKEGRSRSGRFDLATLDGDGKVLHLVRRFARIDAEAFRRALAEAIEEKESRIAGGDIGGVVFAAPEFPPEVVELYVDAIESHASGFRRLQENVTGYAGFVRIGARRGFHLLLVEERGGKFSPLDV
ncbi:MAG: serine/threonine-protein kinase [Thermoanaerobaculia bacterium]